MSLGYNRLLNRCACIGKVLRSLESSPEFQKHSVNQAMCLKTMINANDFTDGECAQLCARVTELGFPPDIVSSLIGALHVCNGKRNGGSKSNVALQHWEAFPDYLPLSRWGEIGGGSSFEALKMIVHDTIRLGLRHPSCPTFGVISSIYSIHEIGAQETLNLSSQEKYKKLLLAKKTFRSMVKYTPQPSVYVVHLPQMVSQFVKEYPSLAEPFYMGDVAVSYPFDACFLKLVCEDMPKREPKDDDKHANAMPSTTMVPYDGGSMNISNLLQTVMGFMDKMSRRGEPLIEYTDEKQPP